MSCVRHGQESALRSLEQCRDPVGVDAGSPLFEQIGLRGAWDLADSKAEKDDRRVIRRESMM